MISCSTSSNVSFISASDEVEIDHPLSDHGFGAEEQDEEWLYMRDTDSDIDEQKLNGSNPVIPVVEIPIPEESTKIF